ncbi:MAG: PEP/pyruvate-binding domain-containing protein [Pseudomonadota bacterium]
MTQQTGFVFKTKAETLNDLKDRVTTARVPDLLFFSLADWATDQSGILGRLMEHFGGRVVVVRSSALAEDAHDSSLAGQFESLLSIPTDDRCALKQAIETVAQSMPGDARDKVLVQEMTQNTLVSGVIMTFDVTKGAPYYSIEFDDETGRTDVVTSGSGEHKSLSVFRKAKREFIKSSRVQAFLDLAQELEGLTNCAALDIEFGLDDQNQLFLYQVRRIVFAKNWHPVTERRVARQLDHLDAYLEERSGPHERLLGDRTILAVMPDWNPAEIIGTAPKPLAASLYRYLVTDAVWSRARSAMGYRDLGDTSLMVLMGQQPYIDVRCSFNSFLPDGVDEQAGHKLVNAWMDRLEAHPEFHDKVEFEIVPTCIDFLYEQKFKERYGDLLSASEFANFSERLTNVTRAALTSSPENTLTQALQKIEAVSAATRRNRPELTTPFGHLMHAQRLLQTCRDVGTLQFAIAARHGFIAETLLRSAVEREALTAQRFEAFKRSIRTVTGAMLGDFARVSAGKMSQSDFIEIYGHLRPGTYEITSLRYDERADDLFQDNIELPKTEDADFRLTQTERDALDELLRESRLDVLGADDFMGYCGRAIAAREDIKFAFSRLLSDALSSLMEWGYPQGLSRKDLSYLTWSDIEDCIAVPLLDDVDRHFLSIVQERRQAIETTAALKFAHIISRPRDIYVATMNRSVPNFIGKGQASGRLQVLSPSSPTNIDLEGRIVCIENADPGFDWLFSKGIMALVTRFGGANSHMAVRCAELGIPAAIGCGDQLFERIKGASAAELNCTERYLRPTHV